MKYFISLITLLFLFTSFSQNASTPNNDNLKILSWNIYMLPNSTNLSTKIKRSKKKERASQISDTLNNSDYDIIVFQEAFHIASRKILEKKLQEQFPYQYGPVNAAFIKTNSGIFIVSKVKLKELGSIQYKGCTGIDCFSKKGVGIFEGHFKGKTFQIAGTHLDSGSQSVREKQYTQAYEKILKPFEKEGVPQIFCGDFNTRKSQPERYVLMLKSYDAEDIVTNSERKNTTVKDNAIIDFILLRKNDSKIKVIDKQVKIFKSRGEMIDKLSGNLSDHLAIEITIKL